MQIKELSPAARRLFELSRSQDEPDALARNRVERALLARIALEPSAAPAGNATPSRNAFTKVAAGATKSIVVASVVGTVISAGWLATRFARHAPPSVPARPELHTTYAPEAQSHPKEAPSPPSPAAKAPPERSEESPARRQARGRPGVRREPTTAAGASSLGTPDVLGLETGGLRAAQNLLRESKPLKAIELLDRQDVEFRKGALQEERAAARVLALCQAGLISEARERAQRFERQWPRSALLARVRAACSSR